jgi:hypothetical protein
MLEHITTAALPLIDLLAGAPHPLVVGEGFGGLDEGGAVGGAHVGRQVLQPRGLQVLALGHVQAVLTVLHTQVQVKASLHQSGIQSLFVQVFEKEGLGV